MCLPRVTIYMLGRHQQYKTEAVGTGTQRVPHVSHSQIITEATTSNTLSDSATRPSAPSICQMFKGWRRSAQVPKSLLIELAIAFNSTSDTGDTWQVVLIKTSTTYSITGQMYTNLSTSIWPFHKNSLELKSSPALIVRSVSNHSQLFAAAVRLVHILTVVVIFYLSNAQCNVENEK
jgi:hypothetical protein